jgi:hypothetical protein
MLTVPACPVGGSEQFTKNLQINYLPGDSGAIQNPQSLTLRLVFNGRSWRDNDQTVVFQRRDDGSWQASVPLSFQWVYAIWYVRDEASGERDDPSLFQLMVVISIQAKSPLWFLAVVRLCGDIACCHGS